MPEHHPPQERRGAARPQAAAVVLDTNIVLDCFWFVDARAAGLVDALESGALRWLATAPMRAELYEVLHRLAPWRHGITREQALTSFDKWVTIANIAPPVHALRCTDTNDQPFIDLAVHVGARWLFSRDRAVLKLARRAAAFGCSIATADRLLKV